MSETVLDIQNLKVVFPNERGIIRAVEGIDLKLERGKCVALVGESGCGKSVTSLAAMKLLGNTGAIVRADKMELCGTDIRRLSDRDMQEFRGKQISMIFQDALSALNPVMTVGKQLDEIFLRHLNISKKEAKAHSIEALRLVGVPDPAVRYKSYPHELSGGMRQRVLIAMAFACSPDLIIADEPTTALDVTIQAQVLDVLSGLQKSHNTALLLITHDFSVVVHMADEICVMYSGKIVERASARELFHDPLHPYTRGLIGSVAKMEDEKGAFVQIPDSLPNPMDKPEGCYFHPRCPCAVQKCRSAMPPLRTLKGGRQVRCWLAQGREISPGQGMPPELKIYPGQGMLSEQEISPEEHGEEKYGTVIKRAGMSLKPGYQIEFRTEENKDGDGNGKLRERQRKEMPGRNAEKKTEKKTEGTP